jgi:nucleotide-binding universal stress UspA family protein
MGRALAGSVPDQLLSHAPRPLLVVPPGRRGLMGVIGVAFDGGEESRAALRAAEQIAYFTGARIVVIGVAEPPAFLGTGEVPASRPTLGHEVRDPYDRMQQAGRGGRVAGSRATARCRR